MKPNILRKITEHPDRDEIVSKLTLNISTEEINSWLKNKYKDIKSTKLIIGIAPLNSFKNEYLDLYNTIRQDALQLYHNTSSDIEQNPQTFINSNNTYRAKLQEYIDKEVDIKKLIKNLIVATQFRIEQIYDMIQDNPKNTKPDYVIIQWIQTITNLLEKQEAIINGSPDKIMQQNNINIQILDQHVGVFQKVIREVISRLDNDTSLLFVSILNDELQKLKPSNETLLPVDLRLNEVKNVEGKLLKQLDTPFI